MKIKEIDGSKILSSEQLLLLEQLAKQNNKIVKAGSLVKIVLDLPLNKIESHSHKFFINFDVNAQVKSLVFFFLFSGLFPYVNYKKTKNNPYFFSFKVVLTKRNKHAYLVSLFEENKTIIQPKGDYYSGKFKTSSSNVVLNTKSFGTFFPAIEELFNTVYSDLRLKTFYFKTSFIFNREAPFKSVDFFIRQNFLFWAEKL